VCPFLKYLSQDHIKSGWSLEKILEKLGIRPYFSSVIFSERIGVEKPDPESFRIALREIDSVPERTLYISNSYHVDIIGARSSGIKPILIDRNQTQNDVDCLKITSLSELPDLLEITGTSRGNE